MIVTKKYVISTPYIDAYLKRISYGTDKHQIRVTAFIVMNVQWNIYILQKDFLKAFYFSYQYLLFESPVQYAPFSSLQLVNIPFLALGCTDPHPAV